MSYSKGQYLIQTFRDISLLSFRLHESFRLVQLICNVQNHTVCKVQIGSLLHSVTSVHISRNLKGYTALVAGGKQTSVPHLPSLVPR